ncbi:hypothetical protein NC99_07890 [Sunxiuqinia dokdonensis]|uniref:Uncharacterized protein n=1 Tax=Sunxiuqinia dokdonensis TaxID=1409788 RepID=A0A0L8VDY0_9BACT|nr:hypothetical protein NC99_07890 [Sunxiuqinia dokdonensis]
MCNTPALILIIFPSYTNLIELRLIVFSQKLKRTETFSNFAMLCRKTVDGNKKAD